MDQNKTIKIKAELDASKLDSQINEMRQKISKLQSFDKPGSSGSQFGGEFGRMSQRSVETDRNKIIQDLRKEYSERFTLMKREDDLLNSKNKRIESLQNIQKKSLDQEKELNKLLEDRSKLEVKMSADREKATEALKALGQDNIKGLPGISSSQPTGTQASTAGQPQQQQGIVQNLIKAIGPAAIISGAIDMLGKGLASQQNIFTNKGQANATMYGELANTMQAGRGSDISFFKDQRKQAVDMTAQTSGRSGFMDSVKVGGVTAAGALGGAKAGALMGSFLGPAGTALGGLGGGLLGAGAGFLGATMSSNKLYSRVFDQDQYKSIKSAEDAQMYQANLEAAKMQNIKRTMGFEYLQKNRGSFMQMQRSTGLSDQGLTGVLRGNEQFTTQATMGAMGSLLGAGAGSQDINAGNTATVLKAQRSLGQGNAAGVLGRLLGAGGSSEDYTKLLASSQISSDKMPMEMSRFAEIASQVATSRGGVSESAMSIMGAGLTGFNQQQISAAGGAAQEILARGRSGQGIEGALGHSFLRGKEGEKFFGKNLDPELQNQLLTLNPQELEANKGMSAYLARKTGKTEEEIKEGVRRKNLFQLTRTGQAEEGISKLAERTAGMSPEEKSKFLESEEGQDLYYGQVQAKLAFSDSAFRGMDANQQKAYAFGAAGMEGITDIIGEAKPKALQESIASRMEMVPEKGAELQELADAKKDQAGLKNFMDYSKSINDSAKNISESMITYQAALEVFIKATKAGSDSISAMKDSLDDLNRNQSVGGLIIPRN